MSFPVLDDDQLERLLRDGYSLHGTSKRINGISLPMILEDSVQKNHLPDWKGKRIAVIGNSRSLLSQKRGEEIDSYEIIIRCNLGPTEGFEEYVGSETHYRVISCKQLVYRASLMSPWPGDTQRWLKDRSENLMIRFNGSKRLLLCALADLGATHNTCYLEPGFGKALSETLQAPEASIGFTAIALAVSQGGKVSAFGFDFHQEHYFPSVGPYLAPPRSPSSHRFDNEKRELQNWQDQGLLQWHH